VLIVLALGWILYIGIKESATANSIMVWIKVAVIVIFILAGISYIDYGQLASLPAGQHGQGRRIRRQRTVARHGDHLLFVCRLRRCIDHRARDAQSAA
jgi:amino acid transporter